MKLSVMFARFPGNRVDDPDTTDWLVETVLKAKADERIGRVVRWWKNDTPITMTRNECVEVAKREGVDVLVMVDNDMKPDAYLAGNPNRLAADPLARPFWDTAFNFLCEHQGPCVVGVPYCGPPPVENIYVFEWAKYQSDNPNADIRLEQFTREQAAIRTGFEEVGALPTGLIMFHMKALEKIKPPYFYYEWSDETESKKASTEDVTFTRDLSLAGVPNYVLWDAWAGHWKRKCVGKPSILSVDDVRESFREAVLRGQPRSERLVMIGEGKPEANGHTRPGKRRVKARRG
jgi:hypothetical protein